jgi:ABC-type transport system involved in multi-copper enzyme maturation permease subunit
MSSTDLMPHQTAHATGRHATAVPDAIGTADATGRAVTEPVRSVFPNILRSEWAKLHTVRSTYWSLAAAFIAMIGLGAIISATQTGSRTGPFDPVSTSLNGVLLAQLAIGVLGVLLVTSEYSTGMIRSTFIAAPQRREVIVAKAAIFGLVAFVVGTVASFITFFVGQSMLGAQGVGLGSPGALRSVVGVGLYLGLLGVFAVGLGTIIRNGAGAIAALFGLILVVPAVLQALPSSLRDSIEKFLPGNAGQAIFHTVKDSSSLSPWLGIAVFAIYAAASLGIGLVLVRRRDA